jgi:hypothetical protein
MRGIRRQPFTRAGLRFGFHLFPERFIVLRPAVEAPVAAVQPGARSVASIAASISSVPEPHIGSSSGVPGCQPERITIAAARFL